MSDSDSDEEFIVVSNTKSVPGVLSDSVVDENRENAKTDDRLVNQPAQQVEMQNRVDPSAQLNKCCPNRRNVTAQSVIGNHQTVCHISRQENHC